MPNNKNQSNQPSPKNQMPSSQRGVARTEEGQTSGKAQTQKNLDPRVSDRMGNKEQK